MARYIKWSFGTEIEWHQTLMRVLRRDLVLPVQRSTLADGGSVQGDLRLQQPRIHHTGNLYRGWSVQPSVLLHIGCLFSRRRHLDVTQCLVRQDRRDLGLVLLQYRHVQQHALHQLPDLHEQRRQFGNSFYIISSLMLHCSFA